TGIVVRYRFAGREYDSESGLYYMRARYYDPTLGRWISEDPIGIAGGANLFVYAGSDPVNITDPSGLDPKCDEGWVLTVTMGVDKETGLPMIEQRCTKAGGPGNGGFIGPGTGRNTPPGSSFPSDPRPGAGHAGRGGPVRDWAGESGAGENCWKLAGEAALSASLDALGGGFRLGVGVGKLGLAALAGAAARQTAGLAARAGSRHVARVFGSQSVEYFLASSMWRQSGTLAVATSSTGLALRSAWAEQVDLTGLGKAFDAAVGEGGWKGAARAFPLVGTVIRSRDAVVCFAGK
ncbi:MAG: RHS repeat-associated core domain-containing protein, partial [Gemmatimonadales bacterium]|nr:RHS repeat-associated core domain-containing protein [Gemmatimonadales bacterium]